MARVVNGYELLDKLGSGLQGKVYRARNVETGEIVAAKLLDQDAVRRNARVFANLEREITAMQRLTGHPHVVGVKTVVYDVNKPRKRRPGAFRRQIMIVMELAPGGELFQYLMLSKFPEPMARAYFAQMTEALAYAHNKGVAHRDLKPENLLLDAGYGLRVADWGLSAVADDISRAALRTQCGTRAYMAPEVLRGAAYSGEAADVWSAGVILFIFLAGFPPFQEAAAGDWWAERIMEGNYPLFWMAHERSAVFSPEAKDLINGIFVADPARRYKVEDVLKHPWTRGEAMPQAGVHTEMRGRRARILADKGLSLEAEEAAMAAAAAAAAALTAGGAGAGVGVGSTPMVMATVPAGSTASAASSSSAAGSALAGMSMDDASSTPMLPVDAFGGLGMGMGMAGDDGGDGDAFARSASRSAKVAAPVPIALPASHPTFLVLPAARPGAVAPAAAAELPEAGAAASAAPESAEAALGRLAAAAASAGVAIDDDVACSAADAASGGRLTAFTLAGVSAAAAARAVAGALASGLGATVAAKTHEGEEAGAAAAAAGSAAGKSVKLRAALPGGLRVDVRFLRPAAAADADASSVIVDFQRTAGDVLTFNRAFARTAAALAPAIALASA